MQELYFSDSERKVDTHMFLPLKVPMKGFIEFPIGSNPAKSYTDGYTKMAIIPLFFLTWRQNIVELVLWGGYSFIFIGKAGNGANYTARSIKCHAFGWNVPHNWGVLASSDVFL